MSNLRLQISGSALHSLGRSSCSQVWTGDLSAPQVCGTTTAREGRSVLDPCIPVPGMWGRGTLFLPVLRNSSLEIRRTAVDREIKGFSGTSLNPPLALKGS